MTDQSEPRSVDRKGELTEFLHTRRARLKPVDVGLPDVGRRRRVPGLRREELAQLAGVSVAYYTRLEQGNAQNVSADVLDAIARALRLTDAETHHLMHLSKPKRQSKRKAAARPQALRPALGGLLESMELVPAYVLGHRTDILAWNRLAAAVFHDFGAVPEKHRNYARLVFLDPTMRTLYADWEIKAAETASALRMYAGYCADDPELSALVGELSVKSEDFRRLWAAHEVREKAHGSKRLSHPLVGEMELSYESLKLPDDAEQTLLLFHAEPGSKSAESLRLLASWGADASHSDVVPG
ncbi:helix-turn-helix transcriptional regulator [Streptomyces sp. 8L]|uniref:helix-turn-helix transcriptional regulator n=1 Tax=Streptomyces sp. 8L TaxID=2877242 RepID=UPI001CD56081|nr:helix-turn-helix transcriptional regulator [Streptomyces sp. 8L]MCA1218536.1 helix-turn-helix transcriptional regulator [Streptomyces sp. 8L]